MEPNKYLQAIEQCEVATDEAKIKAQVAHLLNTHFAENSNPDVYQFLLNCIDLTTLSSEDSDQSVAKFVSKVNDFEEKYAEYGNVAAICVYSNFASVVRQTLETNAVKVAVCSGNFPSSQARLEVKTIETSLAVADGADEVDIVLNLGYFTDGAYEELSDDISEICQAARSCNDAARVKVILETGALQSAENIKRASVLAMYSGADFIKTSTGKMYPGASVEAAYVMCKCIKDYYEKHGRMVGFKAAGGVRTAADAVKYYTIVKEVLGEEWLTPEWFRIGASSLANNLFSDIIGEEAKPF